MKRKLYSAAAALMLVLSMTACSAGKGTPACLRLRIPRNQGRGPGYCCCREHKAAADASTMERESDEGTV
ncbi:hypothetical protein [Enterocloster sp.]|uniref:hypothetical protein n=1 Tax=Enterocloster sp. TaxID=2719315 RepID=UPI0039A0A6CA